MSFELGVFISLHNDIEEEFKKLYDNGFKTCQLNVWDDALKTDENAKKVNDLKEKYGITVTALWCGWEGPCKWNFYDGPATLGIVPEAYRYVRMNNLMRGSDFAKKIGVTDVITHMGYIPENPSTTEYTSFLSAVKMLAEYFERNGTYLLFETGQETPITLKRTIQLVGTGNLGINLDPANLIMYGKANPVDALDVFGEYVRNTHCKDGFYPTDGMSLGKEVNIGEGKVNFPALIKKLKEVGYTGPLTIEREISGEQQMKDIMESKVYLEKLVAEIV